MRKQVKRQYAYCIPVAVHAIMDSLEPRAVNEIVRYRPEYLLELITLVALGVRKNDGESQASAKFLKRIIPDYQLYMQFLIRYGILESDNHYIAGEKCKSYWFARKYYGRFKFHPIKSAWMIRRIERNVPYLYKTKSFPEQMRHLRRLEITDDALTVIDAMPSIHQQNCAMAQFLKLRSGIWESFRDKTSGRLHNIVTTMPSALRHFLYVDGIQTAMVDLKNSQPYFTIILLTDPGRAVPYAKSAKLQELLRSLEVVDTVDAKMFIYLVRTGRVYEYLMANGFTGSRDTVKRKFFVVMYGSPIYNDIIPESVMFERMFPSVFERLNVIKGARTRKRDNRFESYKRLSILLQTMESHVILDVISKRIGRERPNVAVMTIHDSVMTGFLTNHVDYIHDVMCNELTEFVGYPPTLHIEYPKTLDDAIAEMLMKTSAKKVTGKSKEFKSNKTYSYDTINPAM